MGSFTVVFRKLGFVSVVFAFFAIAGGHWAVLQTVAWAEMLRDYSLRTGSIAVAAEQTFDGQHPCELCRKIQAGKSKEGGSLAASLAARDDLKVKARLTEPVFRPLVRVVAKVSFPHAIFSAGSTRADEPPTPPPRRQSVAV